MKIAITDACIFIDLYNLQLTDSFFKLNYEIHTSYDIIDELYEHQKDLLKAYQSSEKLTVHNLEEEDWHKIEKMKLPKALSPNDKTVLYLADKNQCMVLSSDKTVRQQAKKLCCEYHGMLWIFDQLIENKLLNEKVAINKIEKLFTNNIIYLDNKALREEKEKRIKIWSKNI